MSKKRSPLSREAIAAAALAIADAEGFQALSMRRVADKLEVGTMSLYYYVKTKDDLLAVIDDALLGEALLPAIPKGWRKAITQIAERTHAMFLRHPWALASMLSAPPGVNAMRHMEQCLMALAETSMTTEEKLMLLATVDDFVFGHALRESEMNVTMDMDFVREQVATGQFPWIAKLFKHGPVEVKKDRFQAGLSALLKAYGRK